jgi:hypothetical protein
MNRVLITPQRAKEAGPIADDLRSMARQLNTPGIIDLTTDARIPRNAAHVRASAALAEFELLLPPAAEQIGREITVKKTDGSANTVTVRGHHTETIDGARTRTLGAAWSWITVRATTASTWEIVAQGGTVT